MEKRKQFTFYRSYYEAVEALPEAQQGPLVLAILRYGLDGVEPQGLDRVQEAMMHLIKPTLDSGRRRAAMGKLGGDHTQVSKGNAASKGNAVSKGNAASKKEVEIEKEKENENEIEREAEDEGFCRFWQAYPCKLDRDMAFDAWQGLQPDDETVEQILRGLAAWNGSAQWLQDGGRFVPRAAKWLRGRYDLCPPGDSGVPKGASGVLGQAEVEAIRAVMGQ